MSDEKQRDVQAEVYARIAFPALWKLPEKRTIQERTALNMLLGKREQAA